MTRIGNLSIQQNPPELLTLAQAAERLGVDVGALDTGAAGFPAPAVGDRYDLDALRRWLVLVELL